MSRMHNPPHPGEFLQDIYFRPHDLSVNKVAKQIGVAASTVSRLLNGHSNVTPDMALRLAQAFGRSPESWLNMQATHDLWVARKKVKLPNIDRVKLRKTG